MEPKRIWVDNQNGIAPVCELQWTGIFDVYERVQDLPHEDNGEPRLFISGATLRGLAGRWRARGHVWAAEEIEKLLDETD